VILTINLNVSLNTIVIRNRFQIVVEGIMMSQNESKKKIERVEVTELTNRFRSKEDLYRYLTQ